MTVSRLTKVKYQLPIDKHSGIVYEIPCTCGKVYVGETIRRLGTRIKEHKEARQSCSLDKSAIAEHAWTEHHPITPHFRIQKNIRYFHTLVHFFKCLFRLHVLRVCLCISIHKYGLGVPCMEISNLPIWPLKKCAIAGMEISNPPISRCTQ